MIQSCQRRHNYSIAVILMIALLSACSSTGTPKGIAPIAGFELDRYLGKWYEIARLDHKFERGLQGVTASYSLNPDGSVKVSNSGVSTKTGKRDDAVGTAKFIGASDVAHLKVSFFGPFYGSYIVYELDKENYEYALVSGPDRSYMWILSRTPQMDAERYERLVGIAKENGFDTDALIKVEH